MGCTNNKSAQTQKIEKKEPQPKQTVQPIKVNQPAKQTIMQPLIETVRDSPHHEREQQQGQLVMAVDRKEIGKVNEPEIPLAKIADTNHIENQIHAVTETPMEFQTRIQNYIKESHKVGLSVQADPNTGGQKVHHMQPQTDNTQEESEQVLGEENHKNYVINIDPIYVKIC